MGDGLSHAAERVDLLLVRRRTASSWYGPADISTSGPGAPCVIGPPNMNTLIAIGTGAAFVVFGGGDLLPRESSTAAAQLPTCTTRPSFSSSRSCSSATPWKRERNTRRQGAARDGPAPAVDCARAPRRRTSRMYPSARVRPGDVVVVTPGERFPVDGVVVSGSRRGRRIDADRRIAARRQAARRSRDWRDHQPHRCVRGACDRRRARRACSRKSSG